ncbi:GGDEF domain-containing protein [Butyrivibrio sp. DSM 10294]|uniref:GGDEF domain-containing protein n=1 Tax=Butyrivibrio sp. DSM 10294 TaxID=2972457 RepID=UPI00234E3D43|nr:GGDEF domain-containing protein [Butyrivibrio sp. DSM 10294]MDC7294059.1 GGDEF domain-containing protein [Butyrivibrio sp. DSM 10294]
MQEINSHEIVIDAKNHTMISGDSKADRILKEVGSVPFEQCVTEGYRDLFLQNLKDKKGVWFPTELRYDDEFAYFYIKAEQGETKDTVLLKIVSLDGLLDSQQDMSRTIRSYRAQLDIYEDVFFEYDPKTGMVEVFNAQEAYFEAGSYSIDAFEELLLKQASDKQISAVKSFVSQIRSKTGRFGVKVTGNLLNDDTSLNVTMLEGGFVFFDKEREGVVGHIHLRSSKGKLVAASIKHDSLTGLVDKADITRIAMERIDERCLSGTTLAIVDIDFFKTVNDTYGHQYGDSVIKKIADIISAEVGSDGIVGRFGGDEFLVVFYNITDEETLRGYLRNMKKKIEAAFPDKGVDENTPLSISVGAAIYPKDADTYEDVFMVADYCLYIAKDKGRNRYIIYDECKHGLVEAIRLKKDTVKKRNDRDVSLGDVMVRMFDQILHGDGSSPERILDEFALSFDLQRITLLVGEPFRFRYSSGTEAIKNPEDAQFLLGFLNSDFKNKYLGDQTFIVVNRIDSLPVQAGAIKSFLREAGILSYVIVKFFDKNKRECILMISSIGKQTQWNQMHYKYYRALGDLLSLYSLNF